jgi:hypothetical protein
MKMEVFLSDTKTVEAYSMTKKCLQYITCGY